MMIRKAEIQDLGALAALACRLWPDHRVDEMEAAYAPMVSNPDAAFFLAFSEDTAVGFAQCQLRFDYVEGTGSSPVGYLEGIYVAEGFRKQGISKVLLAA